MKAVYLTGLRRAEVGEAPEPRLEEPTDVLLEVAVVGICGSDMHYYRSGRIGCQVVEYPWIIGHECAGTVLEAGRAAGVSFQPGQRVAVDPLIHCGRCDQCQAGNIHTCRRQKFLGVPGQAPGALVERLVMPAASCFAIPDALTMVQATLAEPLSIALWAHRLAGPADGAKIGILGAGPIGLSVLAACKAAGPCTVYQTDLLDNRLDLARRLGADWTASPAETNVVERIAAAEPCGLDVAFECAGTQETIDQALELLKPCGKVLLVGIPEGDRASFDMNHMRRKEARILNVRRQLHCVGRAVEMLAAGKVNLDPLVMHEFGLSEAQKAMDLAADYRDGVVKAMIHIARQEDRASL